MPGDANYASVSLLLHADGANGSTTFTDNSPTPKTPTVFGNAQISTAQSKFGGASMLFDGAGDYLSYADNAAFELGSSNFCIEAWVRFAGYPVSNGGQYQSSIIVKDVSGTGGRGFGFSVTGTSSSITALAFIGFSSDALYTLVSNSFTFSLNTWYHVEVDRAANLLYLFVDGALLNAGGTAFTTTIQNTPSALKIGASEFDATFKYYLNGYLEDLRMTVGASRHTAAFTAPTRAHPDGLGEVEGVIYDDASSPCARTVRLIRRDTGALVSSAVSDASTGAYILATPTLDEVQRIVLDDSAGTLYNDLIDRVIPA